jgi:hypothetical protein
VVVFRQRECSGEWAGITGNSEQKMPQGKGRALGRRSGMAATERRQRGSFANRNRRRRTSQRVWSLWVVCTI